jgi:carbon-monoxide dehydrogenase medium subunit
MPLAQFVTGFRQVDMAPDEVLTAISFPVMDAAQRGSFIKLGLRRTQAISVVSVAAVLTFADDGVTISSAAISLGAVAPVIVRAQAAEAFLQGKALSEDTIQEAARLALTAASPIDDVRGSAEYRRGMVETLTARILRQLRDGRERDGWPERPVLLWGRTQGKWPVAPAGKAGASTQAIVNGRAVQLPGGLTLLDSLREAGLVGVKEGCAEGECGACTVFLDGMAVLSCLIPAERAAGSEVVTVEGLGDVEHLHPVQQAFVQTGGVQCGYCTPGFIMSTAKLLEERPQPDREAAEEALTGNFCRCTGYRKIIDAVVMTGNLSREGRKPHEE